MYSLRMEVPSPHEELGRTHMKRHARVPGSEALNSGAIRESSQKRRCRVMKQRCTISDFKNKFFVHFLIPVGARAIAAGVWDQ